MNILLCCAAGMSTSLIVTKMEQTAQNQGENHKIWALDSEQAMKAFTEADVVLLGPQVRYLLKTFETEGKKHNIPVAAISPMDYGRCNGEAILTQAKKLFEEKV